MTGFAQAGSQAVLDNIHSRKSVRSYTDEPVAPEQVESLLRAAEALWLGAVWTACYPYEDRMGPTIEALGLPDNVKPYCIVPVGHPAGNDKPKDKWKPENIHYEKW